MKYKIIYNYANGLETQNMVKILTMLLKKFLINYDKNDIGN